MEYVALLKMWRTHPVSMEAALADIIKGAGLAGAWWLISFHVLACAFEVNASTTLLLLKIGNG